MHDWLMVINSNGRYSTILYTIIYIYRNSYCNVNVQYAMLLQYITYHISLFRILVNMNYQMYNHGSSCPMSVHVFATLS